MLRDLPKWTVLANIQSSSKWIGTCWEFFDEKIDADVCYANHKDKGNCPTKRPFHYDTDVHHLGAVHRSYDSRTVEIRYLMKANQHTIYVVNGRRVPLTVLQFDILSFLNSRPNDWKTREEFNLLYGKEVTPTSWWKHIVRLRNKTGLPVPCKNREGYKII